MEIRNEGFPMAVPSGLISALNVLTKRARAMMLLPALLFLVGMATADVQYAEGFFPLGPGRICIYRLQGTAVMDDGTILGMSGTSSITFGSPVADAEGELFPVITITAMEWEGISIMAADTMLRYMRLSEEGILFLDDSVNAVPSIAFPTVLSPGISWFRVRAGSTDTVSVISLDRTIAIPSGLFTDCVGIQVRKGGGAASSRSMELLAPGVGRVLMLEELKSAGGWRIQVIHVLEEIRPD